MAREWPPTPDDTVDPALAPLTDGESEGFELAEAELADLPGMDPTVDAAAGFDDLLNDSFDYDDYAEADEELDPDW